MLNRFVELGSGTCVSSLFKPFDFRHPSGHFIQFNGLNILLDCGEGIRYRLDKIKFDYMDLDIIFISHFHVDHFNLTSLLQSLRVRAEKSRTAKRLKIFGPKNIRQNIKILVDKTEAYDGYFESEFSKYLNLNITELRDNQETRISKSATVKFYKVIHGKMDSYAMRFTLGNVTFVYSGDTGICTGIDTAAHNADYFLCEANTILRTEKSDSSNSGHLSASQAGIIGKKAAVKHLILTHYSGMDSDDVMKQAVTKSGFKGKVSIAKDFQVFPFTM